LRELHTLKPKIDSLRLEIPLHRLNLLDGTLINHPTILVSTITGAIMEGTEEDPLVKITETHFDRGITTRMQKVNRVMGGGQTEERLVIQVNAKMLGERYFEGITFENLPEIYNYIRQLHIVDMEYEDFLMGNVYDVDICMDVETRDDVFEKMLRRLAQQINPVHYRKVGKWFAKNNIGLEIGTRHKSTADNPYVKFYAKGLELLFKASKNNSGGVKEIGEFNRNYLGGGKYDLARVELSFRNREMWDKMGYGRVHTFNDLLNVSKPSLKQTMLSVVKKSYMDKRLNKSLGDDRVLPKDDFVLELISYIVDAGESKDFFMSIVDRFDGSYTARSRYRKMVEQFLDNVAFREKLEANHKLGFEASELGKQFGLWAN
jgi:hypothetical protein